MIVFITVFLHHINKYKKGLEKKSLFIYNIYHVAGLAHLVERHLAKVEVAGPSPVTRSIFSKTPVKSAFEKIEFLS